LLKLELAVKISVCSRYWKYTA